MGQLLDGDPDNCGELGCDKGSHNMTQHATSTAILLFSEFLEENKFAHLILFHFYQMKGHTSVFDS